MAYRVLRSRACRADLEAVFDHLVQSYEALGDPAAEAFDRAVMRLGAIEDLMDRLGAAPHQGTLWPEVLPGLRWTTKDRAIFYFTVEDTAETLTVLAVFLGGQDHRAHVLARILGRG